MTATRYKMLFAGIGGLAFAAILLVFSVYLTKSIGTVRLLGAGWSDVVHFTTLDVHLPVWAVCAVPVLTGLLGAGGGSLGRSSANLE
jgi:hypothetical protein